MSVFSEQTGEERERHGHGHAPSSSEKFSLTTTRRISTFSALGGSSYF